MAARKRKNHRLKKFRFLKTTRVNKEEVLSEEWYTNKQVWKVLDISVATCKRWRNKGWLIASKRPGKGCKVYFNAKHVQDMLRGGLPKVIALFSPLFEFTDCYDLFPGVA